MLTYMHPELSKRLKIAALDRETTAFVIVEEAVTMWLAAQETASGRAEADPTHPAQDEGETNGEGGVGGKPASSAKTPGRRIRGCGTRARPKSAAKS